MLPIFAVKAVQQYIQYPWRTCKNRWPYQLRDMGWFTIHKDKFLLCSERGSNFQERNPGAALNQNQPSSRPKALGEKQLIYSRKNLLLEQNMLLLFHTSAVWPKIQFLGKGAQQSSWRKEVNKGQGEARQHPFPCHHLKTAQKQQQHFTAEKTLSERSVFSFLCQHSNPTNYTALKKILCK